MATLIGKSYGRIGLALCFSGLCWIFGLCIDHTRLVVPKWLEYSSIGIQFVGILIITVIVWRMAHHPPTANDLIQAAQAELKKEKLQKNFWAQNKIKDVKYGQMTRGEKLFYVFFLIFGVLVVIYGIIDCMSLIPGEIKIPDKDGYRTIPFWISGFGFIFAGILIAMFSHVVIKFQIIPRRHLYLVPKKPSK